MMGPRPQCYIPSHKVIGLLVLEKIFEGFLRYMGLAAILVMWPRPREQIFIPPSHWGSIWNLALTGPAVLEKQLLKMVDDGQTTDGRRRDDDGRMDRQMTDGPWLYYKFPDKHKDSSELKRILTLANNFLWWTYFGPRRFIHPWTTLVHAMLCISDVIDKCNSWLADITFDWSDGCWME